MVDQLLVVPGRWLEISSLDRLAKPDTQCRFNALPVFINVSTAGELDACGFRADKPLLSPKRNGDAFDESQLKRSRWVERCDQAVHRLLKIIRVFVGEKQPGATQSVFE